MYHTAKAEVLDIVQEFRQLDPVFLKVMVGSILFAVVLYLTLYVGLWCIAILQGLA